MLSYLNRHSYNDRLGNTRRPRTAQAPVPQTLYILIKYQMILKMIKILYYILLQMHMIRNYFKRLF
jgi:hypothetical protein